MEIIRESHSEGEDLQYERVLNMAMTAGRVMLENGAEISRVEEVMIRLAKAYDVTNCSYFVLSNGIFTTGTKENARDWKSFAKVEHIPVKGARLDKVDAINQLSRDIVNHRYTLEQTEARLQEIQSLPPKPAWAQILASGIGAAAFSIIFGGSLRDAAAALIAGLIVWIFMLAAGSKYLGKIIGNIAGGFLVALVCIGLHHLRIGDSLAHVLIGGIIPLVPGVAFVNGIRDVAEGDYISGCVRLLDSLLVFSCIAVGCVVCYEICQLLGGGFVL